MKPSMRWPRLIRHQSRIVELRYFGGFTIEETAEVMKLSPATIKREWTMARAWLHQALTERNRSPQDSQD